MAGFTLEQWMALFVRVGVPPGDAQTYAQLFVDNDMPSDLALLDREAISAMGVKKMGHVLLIMKLRPHPPPTAPHAHAMESKSGERAPLLAVRRAIDTPCRNHPQKEATQLCGDCQGKFCLACVVSVAGQNNSAVIVCRQCANDNCCHGPSAGCLLL